MTTSDWDIKDRAREFADLLDETISEAEVIYGEESDVVIELGNVFAGFKEIFSND